jgi:hypothetical protein
VTKEKEFEGIRSPGVLGVSFFPVVLLFGFCLSCNRLSLAVPSPLK